MILLIDHFDSFVETLARYVREAGGESHVLRVDAVVPDAVVSLSPEAVILSPGPGRPEDTPQTLELIARLPETPILGVCLGHQALCEAYGGATVVAPQPMHGHASQIHHEGGGLFEGVPSPFRAGKYHSLLGQISEKNPLKPIAWDEGGALMAVQHQASPHFGVQFHPESLLTPDGRTIMQNFLSMADKEAR